MKEQHHEVYMYHHYSYLWIY